MKKYSVILFATLFVLFPLFPQLHAQQESPFPEILRKVITGETGNNQAQPRCSEASRDEKRSLILGILGNIIYSKSPDAEIRKAIFDVGKEFCFITDNYREKEELTWEENVKVASKLREGLFEFIQLKITREKTDIRGRRIDTIDILEAVHDFDMRPGWYALMAYILQYTE